LVEVVEVVEVVEAGRRLQAAGSTSVPVRRRPAPRLLASRYQPPAAKAAANLATHRPTRPS